jgi:hypothetical protein
LQTIIEDVRIRSHKSASYQAGAIFRKPDAKKMGDRAMVKKALVDALKSNEPVSFNKIALVTPEVGPFDASFQNSTRR